VHAAKQVLHTFQRADAGFRARTSQVADDFERIPQLFHGNPDLVQSVGQVDGAGGVNGRLDPLGAASRSPAGSDDPCLAIDGIFDLADLALQDLQRLSLQPLHVDVVDLRRRLALQDVPLVGDRRAQRRDRAGGHASAPGEFLEHQQRHVEFAHRPEHPGEASRRPLETPAGLSRRDERQRFAQPTRSDARLMHRTHITVACAGQHPAQCGDPLLQQQRRASASRDRHGDVL